MTYPIEKQVCTLPQAQELAEIFKKAGVKPPESYFAYVKRGRDSWSKPEKRKTIYPRFTKIRPVYTCAELGVLLPKKIGIYGLRIVRSNNGFRAAYFHEKSPCIYSMRRKHEAHAKADLLLALFDQNILKPEEVSYET